jgi:hypothetical protein
MQADAVAAEILNTALQVFPTNFTLNSSKQGAMRKQPQNSLIPFAPVSYRQMPKH